MEAAVVFKIVRVIFDIKIVDQTLELLFRFFLIDRGRLFVRDLSHQFVQKSLFQFRCISFFEYLIDLGLVNIWVVIKLLYDFCIRRWHLEEWVVGLVLCTVLLWPSLADLCSHN